MSEPNVEPTPISSPAPAPVPPAPEPAKPAPIAKGGNEPPEPAPEPKSYWPEDWRQKVAEHVGAGDKKAIDKEIRRLQRFSDPNGIYAMARELEAKFGQGGLLKMPGKDAKEEEIAAFNKALGVPEKAEDYFKELKLDNGAVIGEQDRPLVDSFAAAVHKVGATPAVVQAALNWYYADQEKAAADLDEADETFRTESVAALKEELGPAFQRKTNAIAALFTTAPGGTDANNENSVFSRLLGGRTSDGKIIGNDPDVTRWLISLAQEAYPEATVVESGASGAKGIDQELEEIRSLRKTDKRKYFSEPVQARERELLNARERSRERQRA